MRTHLLFCLLIATSMASQADVYKCKTPSGGTTISDIPCDRGARIDQVRPSESGSSAAQSQYDLERQRAWLSNRDAENAAMDRSIRQQQAVVTSAPVVASDPTPTTSRSKNRYATSGYGQEQANSRQQKSEQYFMNNGGMMQKPAGSSFAHDNKGNAYFKPEGGSFSYGKGGKTCFHYGAFADCR